MRLRVRFPIRNKLLLLMGTLVVFSIVTYLTLAIKLFRDDQTTVIYELNSSSVRTLSSEFRTEVQNLITRVNLLAQGYRNTDWVQILLESESDLLGFSLYRQDATGQWNRVSFLDHSKEYRTAHERADDDFSTLHQGRADKIQKTAEQGFWIGILNRERYPRVASLMRRVTFEGDAAPAIAVADFSVERFSDQVRRTGIATLAVVSSDGEVLVSGNDTLNTHGKFEDPTLVKAALSSPVALQMSEYSFLGQQVLAAFADVGIGGLKVISWVPTEQAFRASARLINKSVLFGLFLITLGLFFAVRVARSLTDPLTRLVEATEAVQAWRFDEAILVNSRDEVGALSQAFNTMATNLQKQREQMGEMQLKLVLSERLAAVGQVARGVGHEFGNILMRVMGKMDLALADAQDQKVKDHLKVAIEALERASKILQNMRSFSRRETQFGEVSLPQVVEQARSLMNHELRMKNIQWVERHAYKGKIEADPVQLGQVFLNLFINATHAMPQGGTLTVESTEQGESVEIRVADTGTGIPPEVLPRIFEPTFTTKGEQGSGLGLSVSQDILEQHGGSIRVDSKPGEGTCFTVTLPKAMNKTEKAS